MNLSQIWQATLGTIQLQTSRQEFDTWLRSTTLLSLEQGLATVGTATPFHKEHLENRYMVPVRRSLGDVVGFPVQVQFIIAPPVAARTEQPAVFERRASLPEPEGDSALLDQDSAEEPTRPLMTRVVPFQHNGLNGSAYNARPRSYANGLGWANNTDDLVQHDLSSAIRSGMLNPKYTFDSFIVGSSNRLANAACQAVADHPAQAYNPLFLYGGVGLGKTHLLHAIGNLVLDRDPEINVLYVSSEKFTNDLINAIRRQQTEEFRLRYRNIDVLLIDDIQFIAGKDATQEEFFHTFNTLHSATKQIVISSDRPPKAIVTLEERLRSRFEWGLIVDIQAPDLETRTAILRAKGEQINMLVPPEVIDFLANKIQSNIRELEGCLNRVTAYARLHNTSVTTEVAASALAELLDDTHRKRITPDEILKVVSEYYGIDTRVIQGRGRSRNVVVPRQVVMHLLREETGISLVEIGNFLGGRDHTTVIHGCEKITEEIKTDTRLRNEIMAIREKLYER
ncbi:MAG: chromosomal replication initiator protein DnaA [Chloroflexaceae bacterium]|nr:chromosomal replication initiator protein DnaA [Chloroflexaceae bacterium]NJO04978.1 chromosomal replication initiator protein DnaA [Chloroflexaceae bacterium]